jgi:NADH-quinone oxidoreductase subunit G
MPTLFINDQKLEVPAGLTVIQACEIAGVEIPRFCYHERLAIAGNCRMCLVEMEKAPKPIASCAMPVGEGMVIRTDTDIVKKARQGVMEFLLINHPLDCPICDQGGECDLQDQAMAYGMDHSRYRENKRAVKEKYMGPLIKTIMTRCIHCTRCVRFAEDIAGVPMIGAVSRGESMEITTLERAVASELSANVIDLCPVGALTSKPYAFEARPWELRKTESIDVLDALGSNIRIDARGAEVLRVLPRIHEDVNEEWLSDKSRYACDGLVRQRLDRPYVRGDDGKLRPASWEEAFTKAATTLRAVPQQQIAALAGDLMDAESMYLLRVVLDQIGTPHRDCRQDGALLDPSDRSSYLFNTTVAGIEEADAILLIGTNPRREAPVLNARIRKRFLSGKLRIGVVGGAQDLTYPYSHIGETARALDAVFKGNDPAGFGKILSEAKRPMLVIGMGALTRPDAAAIVDKASQIATKYGMIADGWNGYNVLQTAAARVGGIEAGFVPGVGGMATAEILAAARKGTVKVVYLLGADEIDTEALKDAFVIYQGHHGDKGAQVADVIFPGAAYTEKQGSYMNLEGRLQRTQQAVVAPGEAREDWKILRVLAERLGTALPFLTLADVQAAMAAENPVFAHEDAIVPAVWQAKAPAAMAIADAPFALPIRNFYMTDPISRHSKIMAECTRVFVHKSEDLAIAV